MRTLLLTALATAMVLPVWADRGGRGQENATHQNVPPAGVYGEQRATNSEWRRDTERRRSDVSRNRLTPQATGRARAMQVSRGKHKGWYKGKGNQKLYRQY